MGRIVLVHSMSLDGYFEGPNRELDWHLVDEELHAYFNEVLAGMGAFMSGRVTHELMAGYWPMADTDPENPPTMREFAKIWRDKPKFVYSRTLASADWNTTVVHRVDAGEVRALAATFDADLALGGADLAAEFDRLGLIDEYRIYVMPIILGAGRPLLPPRPQRSNLTLVENRTFGNGVALLRYQR